MEIIERVKKHAPITGENLAEMLGIARPTIRSDLALLVMLGYLDAKPKVGYFLGKTLEREESSYKKLDGIYVKDVMGLPVVLQETATVNDAVVSLFLENVGTLMIVSSNRALVGIVSRKDLLKVTLGNAGAPSMPISLVMTRQPNIVTVSPEDHVIDAARKMMHHQVDSLPVVSMEPEQDQVGVIGRITKTTMTKLLLELAAI
ncbi:helix-turn-helix transcriptional regulator [Paenibacillus frigoriresistens]|uniref:helix-turn-helix transcriptional regulator n=1 Tax=Paenibacillus alginolyticus TaxID=59839 RepID=UPI001564ACCD|nr:helix-turn-helix transcriptional regulator [Paenibacillus frigoriresistens]NRF92457.1 helix-turn-helix transcriptional regulator [Paenibacillus frigoriresistens]